MSGLLRVRGKTEEKSRREAKEIFKWQAMVVMIQSKRTKKMEEVHYLWGIIK